MTMNYTLSSFCKDKLAKITNNQPDRNIQLAQVIDLIKMSSASTSGLASSGILDGKVPVFVFPVQLDFYYEDQTTHKRVVTIYNPYEFDVTFKVILRSKRIQRNLNYFRFCAIIPRNMLWLNQRGKFMDRNVQILSSGKHLFIVKFLVQF